MQDKPRLRPPTIPVSFSRDPRHGRLKLIAFLGFGILVAAVAGVILLLPALVERGPDRADGAVQAASPLPAAAGPERAPEPELMTTGVSDPELNAHSQRVAGEAVNAETTAGNKAAGPVTAPQKTKIAEQQLEIALQRQARLENAGVRIWGVGRLVTSYAEATRNLVDGDRHVRAGDFDRAAAAYRQAASRFEQLAVSRPERLDRALKNGAAALAQLDNVGATHHFEIALAAEPGNAVADNGLRRARNLPRVLELLEKARQLEAAGQLDRALQVYREAEILDSEFQRPRDARLSVERRIAGRDYRRALSDALSALDRRDYSRSKGALAIAKKLRPNAAEIREIAIRMQAAIQRDRLDDLRRQAGVHDRNEDWAASLRVYDNALGIDADAAFAVQGKSRAKRFLALNRQLDHYLSQPDRLYSPEPLAHARRMNTTIAAIENAGAKLAAKSQRLSALIVSAMEPQPVILRSDENTSVAVHRVARFGKFKERRLTLRPGTYTAFGSRPGYRDVRIRFSVRPSSDGVVVVVRCEERV